MEVLDRCITGSLDGTARGLVKGDIVQGLDSVELSEGCLDLTLFIPSSDLPIDASSDCLIVICMVGEKKC
jgi:hypothetical protein